MNRFLSQWCEQANQTGVSQLQKMAKTLAVHRRGILNWWVHSINNGRMEGTNNKIKTLRACLKTPFFSWLIAVA